MPNFFLSAISPWRTLQPVTRSLLGVLLTTGLATVGLQSAQGSEVKQLLTHSNGSNSGTPHLAQAPTLEGLPSADAQALSDGVYLYGQSAEPDQIGQAYMVFEVKDGNVLGAFYMPRSSFDCFYGTLRPQELALTIINSYDSTTHPYAIALQQDSKVASSSGQPAINAIQLEGYQKLKSVSDNDERILSVCQANHQDKLK